MILILAAATLVSVVMGEGAEAATIIIIVLMNATMGFLQEMCIRDSRSSRAV